MPPRPLAILVVALVCVLPASAHAAGGWSAPVTISGDGASRPRAVMTDEGAAVAAWSGASVQAATRPRGGSFATVETLSSEPGILLDLAGDPGGELTTTWVTADPAVDTAWGTAGEFGPRVRFPFAGVPLVAAVPGGDAFYAWVESDGRLLAVRRHEGTFGRPREVASGLGLAAVAVDAAGALTFVGVAGDGTVLVATGTPEAGFSAPRAISGTGSSAVRAATGARGDLMVTWTTPTTGLAVAVKPAGADWGSAEAVPGSQRAQQLDLALDDEGNAILAWTDGSRARVGYRHADGRWEPAARLASRPVCCTPGPPPCCELHPRVGFDGRGAAVILWADADTAARTLRAAVRPPEGPVRPFEVVKTASAAAASLSEPDLAVDSQRNAVAVWTATALGTSRVESATFDPTAPTITAFAPGTHARPAKPSSVIAPGFAYLISEPATVRVDIELLGRPARRLGTLRSLGSSRAGRIRLSTRLETRLARKGRYRATITATTRGGLHPQPRHVDFRRVRRP